jgi:restriction system protein
MSASPSQAALPTYRELMYPVLRAVGDLGGSAQSREITDRVVEMIQATEEQLALTYPNRPKSVLIDRIHWACSYAKLGAALDRPQRGLYVLTTEGREILSLPQAEADARLLEMDRRVRAAQVRRRGELNADEDDPLEDETLSEDSTWTDVLLDRLHRLTPEGFEEFVMYLLRAFELELTRVGGTGDQGIDGIGIAPLSPVLSSRVAVQAKRYDPTSTIGREVVALFQRDASAAGAERAVLVTIGRFSEPARRAATTATPTVDLIDGEKLCELVRQKDIGLRIVPQVQEDWFDRFDR